MKAWHEIRDPVHNFIRVTPEERAVIDSPAVQRLRHIHQLSLSYLVYPGATHRRFEHSLGVMHLAGQVFDVVTDPNNLSDEVRTVVPEVDRRDLMPYWRTLVRMAALCHDLGHLPFSHGAEHELLPEGYSHERLSMDLIRHPDFAALLHELTPPIHAEVLAKLAVGPGKAPGESFSTWEAILTEIVVGDAFGVDRMDYLLRDSLHAGVQYGRFDHHRVIDTLRILPSAPTEDDPAPTEPALGVEEGGLHAAEALLLARYFMWMQVYLHPVRLMYDAHLQDFLRAWLPDGQYPTDLEKHLSLTDIEVLVAMREAAISPGAAGADEARRILRRDHFRRVYDRKPSDLQIVTEPGKAIADALAEIQGADKVKHRKISSGSGWVEFPVRVHDGDIVSSMSLSQTLRSLPPIVVDQVFVDASILDTANAWIKSEKNSVLQAAAAAEGAEQ